jgi:hypothetical protein
MFLLLLLIGTTIGSIQDVEAYVNNLQVFTYGCNNHFVNDRECYDCPFGSKNAADGGMFPGASVNSVQGSFRPADPEGVNTVCV